LRVKRSKPGKSIGLPRRRFATPGNDTAIRNMA